MCVYLTLSSSWTSYWSWPFWFPPNQKPIVAFITFYLTGENIKRAIFGSEFCYYIDELFSDLWIFVCAQTVKYIYVNYNTFYTVKVDTNMIWHVRNEIIFFSLIRAIAYSISFWFAVTWIIVIDTSVYCLYIWAVIHNKLLF